MQRVQFGVEFRTQQPTEGRDDRFLLVQGNQIRFMNPLRLGNLPYESDLNKIMALVEKVVAKEYSLLDLRQQFFFKAHIDLLNRQVEQQNRGVGVSGFRNLAQPPAVIGGGNNGYEPTTRPTAFVPLSQIRPQAGYTASGFPRSIQAPVVTGSSSASSNNGSGFRGAPHPPIVRGPND